MGERAAQVELSEWLEQQVGTSVYWSEDPVDLKSRLIAETLLVEGVEQVAVLFNDTPDAIFKRLAVVLPIREAHYWTVYHPAI